MKGKAIKLLKILESKKQKIAVGRLVAKMLAKIKEKSG